MALPGTAFGRTRGEGKRPASVGLRSTCDTVTPLGVLLSRLMFIAVCDHRWHAISDLAYNRMMVNIGTDDQAPTPSWPTCAHRRGETGRPCNGKQVDGFDHCLTHLGPGQLEQVLERFSPGADLEAPGTNIEAALLARILRAVTSENDSPTFGDVNLTQAHFTEDAIFRGVQFSGEAKFHDAQFNGNAEFTGARFSEGAGFYGAQFNENAEFIGVQFNGSTGFSRAQFSLHALFADAQFNGEALFVGAQVSRYAGFTGVKFGEHAGFEHARFCKDAEFLGTQFGQSASFESAWFRETAGFDSGQFGGYALFREAQFNGNAGFGNARFSENAEFAGAQFSRNAGFAGATFSENAGFAGARFSENAGFAGAQFSRNAGFAGAQFSGDADFLNARFEKAASLGPLTAGNLILQGAVFVCPVVVEAAAVSVTCTDTRWEAGVTMRLRLARVDLERVTLTEPSFVAGADQQFALADSALLDEAAVVSHIPKEQRGSDDSWMPVLSSLRGADASNLSVTDVDLSQCRFAGARLLDQLRLEGRCIFDHPPERLRTGWVWPPVWRWSSRQSLAEERLWRATTLKYSGWAATRSAKADVQPERLEGLYRQLRKAQEDAKNEPGAADFYYGEMEMRRHASTTPAEHGIIGLYWLISGYGLRALRSLAALVIIGVIATAALVGWGLAASTPPQRLTGTVTTTRQNPAQVDATLHTTAPQLPPASQRWTGQRTRTALEVTLESIAFRTTDQPLTPTGTWITIAARILGPILLALTLLAVRNRVKR